MPILEHEEKKMKKSILLFLLGVISFLLLSCNSKKEAELNTKISELSELNTKYQNEIAELQLKITEMEKITNDLTIELEEVKKSQINLIDKTNNETHTINYNIKFDYDGYNIIVYEDRKSVV